MNKKGVIFKLLCPDQRGLVANISSYISDCGGNLNEFNQFTDDVSKLFFARLDIDISSLTISKNDFIEGLENLAKDIKANSRIREMPYRMRTAVLTTKTDHCLNEIIWRTGKGELPLDITSVIGNRDDCREEAEVGGYEFHYVKMKGDEKESGFREIERLVDEQNVELIVLARFMQILPDWFCQKYEGKVINIHHSFLPAFIGARPYKQAYERGVKLIGATCHYVTSDLDAGPIIEQAVERVQHHHGTDDLIRLGRDCERKALAKGVRYHVLERTIIEGNRAIVFED